MRILVFLYFLFTLSIASASTFHKSQIHDIDQGKKDEHTLVFLKSGLVVKLNARQDKDISILMDGKQQSTWFIFKLDKDNYIIDFKKTDSPHEKESSNLKKGLQTNVPFTPSILKDLDQAKIIFLLGRTKAREESQCYNRAHFWAYNWRIKKNLYSSKVWLFFTKKYIRENNYTWWFHVAPMVHVGINGQVKERMMDIKYTSGPIKIKDWTGIFMRDNAECPVVEKYSDQANFPESGSCFLMKSSMYYYQPADLEQFEFNQFEKQSWVKTEVTQAFKDAFNEVI